VEGIGRALLCGTVKQTNFLEGLFKNNENFQPKNQNSQFPRGDLKWEPPKDEATVITTGA
jgi:hypothetical protein